MHPEYRFLVRVWRYICVAVQFVQTTITSSQLSDVLIRYGSNVEQPSLPHFKHDAIRFEF